MEVYQSSGDQYQGGENQLPGGQYPAPQPAAQRRSDPGQEEQLAPQVHPAPLGFTPPPGAYPAPPGSFPHQAAHPPPTYAGDLLAAPSQPTAATSRLGLLPSLLARVRSRMTSIAERRSQVADFFTSIRDMVIAYFMGPEGTARMFSVTSLIIGSILAL